MQPRHPSSDQLFALLKGSVDAELEQRRGIALRQGCQSLPQPVADAGPAEFGQVVHHLETENRHDACHNGDLEPQPATVVDKIEIITVVVKIIGEDKFGPFIYLEFQVLQVLLLAFGLNVPLRITSRPQAEVIAWANKLQATARGP